MELNDEEDKNGDDLLCVFAEFDVQLRKLNRTAVKAWFDTDCSDTQKLLGWLTRSLTKSNNYLSSLDRHEFNKINCPIELQKCNEELTKLDPRYAEIFQLDENAIWLLKNEVAVLEEEDSSLSELIKLYESANTELTSDFAGNSQREIPLQVACKTKQSECEKLCRELDEVHNKLGSTNLIEYNPEAYLVNVINMEMYSENIKHFNFILAPLIAFDEPMLESSEDSLSDDLEIYRNRIFHSYQLYLVKEVEIEKLKQMSNWLSELSTTHENSLSLSLCWSSANFDVKDSIRKNMYETIDEVALKAVDQCLEQTKLQYIKRELETYCVKFKKIKKLVELLTNMLSYYALTICLQLGEAKIVECLSNFYQEMMKYAQNDLRSCCTRTAQMNRIIEEYQLNLAKPDFEKFHFITIIAKLLNLEDCSLKSVAEAVGELKSQLEIMQSQLFCSGLTSEQSNIQQITQNIAILTEFLTSGPTNKIVLIPERIRNVCYLLEEHLKKENDSVQQTVNVIEIQNASKTSNKFDKYARQLWMNFLTNPSKVKAVLEEAEQDFINRTKHYF